MGRRRGRGGGGGGEEEGAGEESTCMETHTVIKTQHTSRDVTYECCDSRPHPPGDMPHPPG